jgi:hypothetical protein
VGIVRIGTVLLLGVVAAACGSKAQSGFDKPGRGGSGDDADGGGTTNDLGGSSDASAPAGCQNLQCKQVSCPSGGATTVSGTVFDPSGNNALYNVAVYVPNAQPDPMTHGATCDRCGASLSGSPVVTALSDTAGHFTLNNVPVGDNVPLVVQVGKWRRQVTIPHVQQCVDTPLDKDLTRLPRNGAEGDLPLIALATGGADELECLFRSNKIGLDDSEFTLAGQGNGHVHFYAASGGSSSFAAGGDFPGAQPFWSDLAQLKKYDIVLLSCEGTNEHLDTKPPAAIQAMHDYAGAGGRIFASHWQEAWFRLGFPEVGTFNPNDQSGANGVTPTTVNTSFPKGAALQQWLGNVGALSADGTLPVNEAKFNLVTVTSPAQTWISAAGASSTPEYMSFNAPTNASADQACGRAVYSNLHVAAGDAAGQPWPQGCTTSGLSPQEKALEFMLFDLSACVQPDSAPPSVPPPVVK